MTKPNTIENLNSLICIKEIENVSERKLQTQMTLLMKSIEPGKIILQKLSENRKDRNTSQLIVCGQHDPDIKTRERHYQKT